MFISGLSQMTPLLSSGRSDSVSQISRAADRLAKKANGKATMVKFGGLELLALTVS
jgi:hypothetical protein